MNENKRNTVLKFTKFNCNYLQLNNFSFNFIIYIVFNLLLYEQNNWKFYEVFNYSVLV